MIDDLRRDVDKLRRELANLRAEIAEREQEAGGNVVVTLPRLPKSTL